MTQPKFRDAIRAIDDAAIGLRSEQQARRLAILRAQLALLAREIEKAGEHVTSSAAAE
ncbi:hypothetical protein N825_07975 [Skermanella stibiiresistens SB22]|uniref:Uncharacterized protein n=1 Tax=Skermanella stibiiresistens SB22 TaxID=1385369 RepID=W9H3J8_9PROT|nr:hypothetical protein N825_07975 [Skermanella stibiiresistens SB22]